MKKSKSELPLLGKKSLKNNEKQKESSRYRKIKNKIKIKTQDELTKKK